MLKSCCHFTRYFSTFSNRLRLQCRYASAWTAVKKGLRAEQPGGRTFGGKGDKIVTDRTEYSHDKYDRKTRNSNTAPSPELGTRQLRTSGQPPSRARDAARHGDRDQLSSGRRSRRSGDDALGEPLIPKDRYRHTEDSEPPHIPLATAASQFIYGRSSALACLRAARRQVHRAYINKGRLQESGYADIIMQLCKSLRIPITQMSSSSQLRSMDRVSSDRPHNGIVLDVSPLPFPPVQALGVPGSSESLGFGTSSDDTSKTVSLSFGPQSVEDKQMNASLKHLVVSSIRPPFVLLLDGIKDEGNMGNIIRTAHFYGVDALAVCSDATAPINSSIVAKAASGATEAVPLLRIDDAVQFLERSKANGWEVWASVAPDYTPEERGGKNGSRVTVEPIHGLPCPPTDKPCIILLGSEDTGLRPFVTRRADRLITIQGSSDRTNVGVDSLNVSTAAAVLIDAFTRTTSPLQALRPTSVVEGSSGPRDKGPQEFKVRKFFKDDAFESD